MKTPQELVAEAKEAVREVSTDEAEEMISSGAIAVDVREPSEWAEGIVPGAHTIPRGVLEFQIDQAAPGADAPIVVYCKSGGRSALATQTLQALGYTNAVSMAGGFSGWSGAGKKVEKT